MIYIEEGFSVNPPPTWWIALIVSFGAVLILIGIGLKAIKREAEHSVAGILIMHEGGAPLANEISPYFSSVDPVILSGAVSGITSIIREMTGHGLRTIEIEGGYMNLSKRGSFWVVIFSKKNPKWIKKTINACIDHLNEDWGGKIASYSGSSISIPINKYAKEYFHIEIPRTNGLDSRNTIEEDLS